MAYPFRGPQSPHDEASRPMFSPQCSTSRMGASVLPSDDVRGGLTRRFTTNALPLGQRMPDYSAMSYARKLPVSTATPSVTVSDRQADSQAQHYDELRRKQREIEAQIEALERQHRVDEGYRHEDSIAKMMANSEPASPPDYGSAFPSAFPSAFSKPNRFSTASMASHSGVVNRSSRSNTQLTSPSSGYTRPYTSGNIHLPSQSVPGSRRQSDDEEDDVLYSYDNGGMRRAAANPNRYSMPITGYDRKRNTTSDVLMLGPVNTTRFLFDDDDDGNSLMPSASTTSPRAKNNRLSLQVGQTADGFPKLIRAEHSDMGSSAALDLALAQGVEPQAQLTDRATANRHRISLPPSALSGNVGMAPLNSILANADTKSAAGNRRSLEVKFSAETKRPPLLSSPPRAVIDEGSKMPSSYSTNDIPTLRTINGDSSHVASPNGNDMNHGSGPTRQQDMPLSKAEETTAYSTLHANAAPFGPMANGSEAPPGFNPSMAMYGQPAFYGGGYAMPMHMLNQSMGAMNLNGYMGQPQWNGNGYAPFPAPFSPGQAAAGASRFGDGVRPSTQQRRHAQEEVFAKYNTINMDDLAGEVYSLCKDQHGCRFLQRKLDERDDKVTRIIFNEVKDHIIELMTDPFGNYLCQKLLESADDEQRTALTQNATSAMPRIALNQHGTRALQKMIEVITTPEQVQMVINALRFDVVQLIQDLNGNHVIQKCLNHLSPRDAQFIFDAVGDHCVVVGTHRHGCCVLQRCIDHASGMQKRNLVDKVIANAYSLVQDPFGNYVVQYILDLSEPTFTEPLCRSFLGNVAFLSKQKFSSNVVEKCIRCASDETRRAIVQEIVNPAELNGLLRDSFANYVVQTAMDSADEESKALLMESVRPILPGIRQTPYGRRIQSKLNEYDGRASGATGTPAEPMSPITTPANGVVNVPGGRGNRQGFIGPPLFGTFAGHGNFMDAAAFGAPGPTYGGPF
ncbi:ARM repeat-containing protein [Piedraia hortae CBS 480.64]|uniref:ARM repeat-containing protein n=1 Tax=Piedraia hortae CBS 480.64 TaxID=1314780 RepID=A0A6A7BU44_9PEZI|nr:ARM repeat-containing protein [Piedraia hortae CBS 480.64]